jgi:hypothetical protein
MEQVDHNDPNGVKVPEFLTRTVGGQVVDMLSHGTEEGGDTLPLDLMPRGGC